MKEREAVEMNIMKKEQLHHARAEGCGKEGIKGDSCFVFKFRWSLDAYLIDKINFNFGYSPSKTLKHIYILYGQAFLLDV